MFVINPNVGMMIWETDGPETVGKPNWMSAAHAIPASIVAA